MNEAKLRSQLDQLATLLRSKIRERGFTQLEVERTLGLRRGFLRELLTRQQRRLSWQHVFRILDAIGVARADFFGELYRDSPAWRNADA